MKKIYLLLIFLLQLSCYNGLRDMYDDLRAKVPICVNLSAAIGGDGRGWGKAYKTIQEAVDAADSGDEIWVANPSGSDSSPVTITKSVAIYGGFNGTESRMEDRDPDGRTLIAGTANPAFDIQSDGVVIRAFKFTKSSGYSIELTKLYTTIISNCDFTGNSSFSVRFNKGFIQVHNCNFYNNTAAAISVQNARLTVTDSIFTDNSGTNGGAIYSYIGTLVLTGNTFNGNTATQSGGAINSTNASDPDAIITINKCTFKGNTAADTGGACCFTNVVNASISNCTFGVKDSILVADRNRASDSGGAVYVRFGSYNINNCVISNNEAVSGSGGGVFGYGGDATHLNITNTLFQSNISGSNGGAVGMTPSAAGSLSIESGKFESNHSGGWGGAVYLQRPTSIINSYFSDNNAVGNGGAVYVSDSTPTLTNLTFYFNRTSESGGAIWSGIDLTVNNTVFYSNTASGTAEDIYAFGYTLTLNYCFYDDLGIAYSSIISNGWILATSNPFLSIVPGNSSFLYPANVIVNKGLDSATGITATDLAGNSRKVGTVDMGCYERQ